jgi:hypothetical protein
MSNPVYRAPIHQNAILMGDAAAAAAEAAQQNAKIPRTRCGYLVPESYRAYEQALGEVGSLASGRALHFAADLICSGGVDIWIRGAYNYAIQHINLANPRIFVYLRQKVAALDKLANTLPQDTFYTHPEVQATICEAVLVLQMCPKRAKITWPKIDDNAKRPGWLRGVASSAETRAVRAVWDSGSDSATLYLVGNELSRAVSEGVSERALFWIRWVLEEEGRVRKETKGAALSTKERGPAVGSVKTRTDCGHFVAAVLVEIYKELAASNLVRMNEEFGELVRLWRQGEVRMAARHRRDCLGLMALICCEVPRWKVPAVPTLVADPVRLSRAVAQAGTFFNEVLAYKPLPAGQTIKASMTKMKTQKRSKEMTEKESRNLSTEEHLEEYDAVLEAYLNKF